MATSTIKPPFLTGLFYVACSAGVNKITSSTTLVSGVFPPMSSKGVNNILLSVVTHGTYENTKDTVDSDAYNIFIHAEKAQNIGIRWLIPNS